MHWTDDGIVLGVRPHGESSALVELMTAAHGRHRGLVRGGRSRSMRAVLQPGNYVHAHWRARLDEHLGSYRIEPQQQNAARILGTAASVHGIQLLASHLRLLPERDPYPALFAASKVIVDHLDDFHLAASLMARFELRLLEELGFGLDLSTCAATGQTQDLIYVSPKSGRAVSAKAGAPWAQKLLALPDILRSGSRVSPDPGQLAPAFHLTGFFLERHIHSPRGIKMPPDRSSFLKSIKKMKALQAHD